MFIHMEMSYGHFGFTTRSTSFVNEDLLRYKQTTVSIVAHRVQMRSMRLICIHI